MQQEATQLLDSRYTCMQSGISHKIRTRHEACVLTNANGHDHIDRQSRHADVQTQLRKPPLEASDQTETYN